MKNRRRIVLITEAILALALLGFVFTSNLIDFPVYYAAGRSLLSGRTDLYSPDFALGRVMDYRYPPLFVLAVSPLSILPYKVAAYVWYLLLAGAAAGSFFIVGKFVSHHKQRGWMWSVIGLGVAQYFVMALHYGNVHILVVFFLFAGMYLATGGRSMKAAFPMACAITIKLTPGFLVPYLALKKKWALLVTIFALLVMMNFVSALYFGFSGNNALLRTWYEHVVASQEFHEQNGPINLSLKGQLRRYLSDIDYSQRIDGDVRYPTFNIAGLSFAQTDAIWLVISVLLLASGLLLIYRLRAVPPNESLVGGSRPSIIASMEIGLMICLMLLVGPLTSKIYFIALLWPIASLAMFTAIDESRTGTLTRIVLVAVAAVNCVLPLLPGRSVQRWLLVLGIDFYVNCAVMIALGYALVVHGESCRKRFVERRTPVR